MYDPMVSCDHDWQSTAPRKEECSRCFAKCERDARGKIIRFFAMPRPVRDLRLNSRMLNTMARPDGFPRWDVGRPDGADIAPTYFAEQDEVRAVA
jgi:hypothetical protein